MTKVIELTNEQKAALAGDGDWLKLTPDQAELVNTAAENEFCIIYGDRFMRLSESSYLNAVGPAYEQAVKDAIKELRPLAFDDIADIDMHKPELGSAFVTATLTAKDGRTATGMATFPDPSVRH